MCLQGACWSVAQRAKQILATTQRDHGYVLSHTTPQWDQQNPVSLNVKICTHGGGRVTRNPRHPALIVTQLPESLTVPVVIPHPHQVSLENVLLNPQSKGRRKNTKSTSIVLFYKQYL